MNKSAYLLIKLMCYVLSLILALCIMISAASAMINLTLADKSFLQSKFANSTTISQIKENLKQEHIDISSKTNIPSQALDEVLTDSQITSAINVTVYNLYKGIPADLDKLSDIGTTYENVITNYLEENDIKYKEENVKTASQLGADAFTNCISISNAGEIYSFLSPFNYSLYMLVLMVFGAIICVCLLWIFNDKRKKALSFIGMSFNVAALVQIFVSVIMIVKNPFKQIAVTEIEGYNAAIAETVQSLSLVYIIIGILFFIAGSVMFAVYYRHYRVRAIKNDTERKIDSQLTWQGQNDNN